MFSCKFCSMIMGKTFRVHSPERMVAEVKRAMDLGITHFNTGDDNIGIDMPRLMTILDAVAPLNCTFRLNMSVGYLTDDVGRAARNAGCTDIFFGIETYSQTMLKKMKKRASVRRNIEAIRKTKQYDIRAKAYLMVNYPGETEETVRESMEQLYEAHPDRWLLSAFVPLPGSESYHNPESLGITWRSENWEDYYLVGNNGSFQPAFETAELTIEKQVELHDMLYHGCTAMLGTG